MRKDREGMDAEEKKEGTDEEVTIKEIDLGDGTRRMLKFEKKEEGEKERIEPESKADNKIEEKKVSEQTPEVREGSRPQIVSQNLEKQINKLEVEITKNRDMIKDLENKVEKINKDLDDLVSLYEIVSEQMNPFVGLSKVTKQRLEMIEKFAEEIESIKNRLEDLEMMMGKIPEEKTSDMGKMVQPTTENLDYAIEKAFSILHFENELDILIEEFLEGLKNE